jgi:hypothetical protein
LKVDRRFGGTCRLHLQVGRMSQARSQSELGGTQNASFLPGFFFGLEDGGNKFLRNTS